MPPRGYKKGEQHIDDRLEKDGDDGCWIWMGAVSSSGYGVLKANRQTVSAHVYFWTKVNGPVPRGKELDHIVCDIELCCNPKHMVAIKARKNRARANHSKLKRRLWQEEVPF
jgi:hypothetical protein